MNRSPAFGTPRWSVAALLVSVVAVLAVGACGPSAAVPPLPGAALGPLPPYFVVDVTPSPELVTALLAVGVLAGAAGLVGALRALRGGWRPDLRRLMAAGALAVAGLAVLPPVGSADPKSYAAYGRMAATGLNPYVTTPRQLAAAGDPVGAAVESPWQDTPSVYGPLATAEQALVARVAGKSVRAAVGLLGAINAVAFLIAGAILLRLADTADRRRRVAVMWWVNPLLLLQLVAGAHVDTIVACAVISALGLHGNRALAPPTEGGRTGRRALLTGLAAGAATAIKLPGGAALAVLVVATRRFPLRLAGLLAGAAAVLGLGYGMVGLSAFDQTRRASRFVSHASPWRPLAELLDSALGTGLSRTLVGVAAAIVTALLAWLFLSALPGRERTEAFTARATLALTLAYLLGTPYALPWYSGTGWALLSLLPASPFDRVLVMYTTLLSLAYLPGRDVPLPGGLAAIADAMRNSIAPLLLLAVVLWAIAVAWRLRVTASGTTSPDRLVRR